ncbi:MAG: permease prefix domain 1-containing protein, partial [Treponema sp.]|nr:permease prefix domain 1-containing protein [Treponema sp.]
GYGETEALADFKEELLSNLNAKLDSLVKKGMSEKDAFIRATAELGDVSTLADEISLKKRQEVFEDWYMDVRRYMKPGRVAFYVLTGAWFVLGIVIALVVFFTGEAQPEAFWESNRRLTEALGVLVGFVPLSLAAFTFLGLTQETASRNPLSKKRGAWYALASAALGFGIILSPLSYFATGQRLMEAIATLIPFAIPALGLLVFLILTEKDTRKPWARDWREKEAGASMEMFRDPAAAARFGVVSGAIWLFALGLFLLLGFLTGFHLSWLVFVFAMAVQLAIQGMMMRVGSGK